MARHHAPARRARGGQRSTLPLCIVTRLCFIGMQRAIQITHTHWEGRGASISAAIKGRFEERRQSASKSFKTAFKFTLS